MLIKFPSGNMINTDLVEWWYIEEETPRIRGGGIQPGLWGPQYSLFAEFIMNGRLRIHERMARAECEQLLDKIAEAHLHPQARPVLIQELVDQVRDNLYPENKRLTL